MAVLGELGSSTSGQLSGQWLTVLVPVGSTEQHGPHLPLDTDTRIADAVARAAGDRLAAAPGPADRDVLVAPAIGYGASGEHQSFPGTVSIGTETLGAVLLEYGRSACCWAQRVVFVNGHGGNVPALAAAVRRLRLEARDVAWLSCSAEDVDAHAGHAETSVLLSLSPEVVRWDRVRAGNVAPLSELLPAMRRGGVAAVSDVGVLGDPTTATAAEGERILAEMIDGCVRAVSTWSPRPDGMLQ
ncbi:mycofactocin biosynthesis peptidyl-dipeptidase MftE [Mycobacterium sp. M1]|uniref:Mycofactocin biosynthesis peptidyl-dipeptidase MftE n=1 Tax=Mycolicibacter acidiphilus TaxID=2835306 RepID=A0ABS5RL70_9MYCO|nr:mycofactocin biosynthesis peptidyl-dipeptidase MftE [Mycolicibacter acidiphilus]MBS9534914.1 mycofactocin biosynthesis peptidyl-dipeptidase MftE [Mycolicibacter acidiphilus]